MQRREALIRIASLIVGGVAASLGVASTAPAIEQGTDAFGRPLRKIWKMRRQTLSDGPCKGQCFLTYVPARLRELIVGDYIKYDEGDDAVWKVMEAAQKCDKDGGPCPVVGTFTYKIIIQSILEVDEPSLKFPLITDAEKKLAGIKI